MEWRGRGFDGSCGVRGGAMAVLGAGLRWVGPMVLRGRGFKGLGGVGGGALVGGASGVEGAGLRRAG